MTTLDHALRKGKGGVAFAENVLEDLLHAHPAYHTLFAILSLMGIGLIMVFSASSTPLLQLTEDFDPMAFTTKQSIWALMALAVLFAFSVPHYRRWMTVSKPLLIFAFILLGVVLLPFFRAEGSGCNRWIRIGGAGFQPSELFKLAIIIFVAATIERKGERLKDFRTGFLPAFSVPLLAMVLIFLEPDFGTGLFIGCLAMGLLILGGMRLRHFVPFFFMALIPLVLFMLTRFDYIIKRLVGFIEPEKCYQLDQSLTAMGSGGILGLGLGNGRAKLCFLPERTTDFIFSVIGEEFGFVGCALVIFLFCVLAFSGIRIALRAKDTFGFFLALGITVILSLQAIINIAVVTASVPAKGIPLPFVSRGGSSLVVSAAAAGILISISLFSGSPEVEKKGGS